MTTEQDSNGSEAYQQRWRAAVSSLLPKLQEFAGGLEPDEQAMLGFALWGAGSTAGDVAGHGVMDGGLWPPGTPVHLLGPSDYYDPAHPSAGGWDGVGLRFVPPSQSFTRTTSRSRIWP